MRMSPPDPNSRQLYRGQRRPGMYAKTLRRVFLHSKRLFCQDTLRTWRTRYKTRAHQLQAIVATNALDLSIRDNYYESNFYSYTDEYPLLPVAASAADAAGAFVNYSVEVCADILLLGDDQLPRYLLRPSINHRACTVHRVCFQIVTAWDLSCNTYISTHYLKCV